MPNGAMEHDSNETGWRGSSEVWLGAAYDALLDAGVDAVRIVPLAKKLKLSRTSFYWFFKDREALLDGLVARWRDLNTGGFVEQTNAYAENLVEAVLNVHDCWFDQSLFDAKLEFAIRSWALQSGDILAEVKSADAQRLGALRELYRRFGVPELEADVRARAQYLTQIGYISMQTTEDKSFRMQRIPQYLEIWTGMVPEKRDLDRFFARHGVSGLT